MLPGQPHPERSRPEDDGVLTSMVVDEEVSVVIHRIHDPGGLRRVGDDRIAHLASHDRPLRRYQRQRRTSGVGPVPAFSCPGQPGQLPIKSLSCAGGDESAWAADLNPGQRIENRDVDLHESRLSRTSHGQANPRRCGDVVTSQRSGQYARQPTPFAIHHLPTCLDRDHRIDRGRQPLDHWHGLASLSATFGSTFMPSRATDRHIGPKVHEARAHILQPTAELPIFVHRHSASRAAQRAAGSRSVATPTGRHAGHRLQSRDQDVDARGSIG